MDDDGKLLDKVNLLRSVTRHRAFVGDALHRIADELRHRERVHDLSKLLDDEFEGFARINAAARINRFGSPEYKAGMERERATVDLHFGRNSHHPERPGLLRDAAAAFAAATQEPRPVPSVPEEMTFLDVIEMVCDWWGARLGYDDQRSWEEGLALNLKSKGVHLTEAQLWLAREVGAWLAAT